MGNNHSNILGQFQQIEDESVENYTAPTQLSSYIPNSNDDLLLLKSFKHEFEIKNSILSKNGNLLIRDIKGSIHWIVDDNEDDSKMMSILRENISLKIRELQKEHQSLSMDIRPQEIINPIKIKITPDYLKMQQKALLSTITNYLLPLPSESITHFLRGL